MTKQNEKALSFTDCYSKWMFQVFCSSSPCHVTSGLVVLVSQTVPLWQIHRACFAPHSFTALHVLLCYMEFALQKHPEGHIWLN